MTVGHVLPAQPTGGRSSAEKVLWEGAERQVGRSTLIRALAAGESIGKGSG